MRTQFSEPQIKAIEHYTGPALILAGPGSGKTLVITYRTKNLIEKYGVNPSNILVITFTKAAALEMQERFEKLMDGDRVSVTFGTFHAIFFKILKYAYHYRAENIIREDDKYRIVKELIDHEQLEIEDENDFIASIINEISNVKGDLIDISNYYSSNCSDAVFRKIYQKYDDKLRQRNQIDFDDMLLMCYELFKARPDILSAWQKKYQFVLVDEFQDINRIQYEIVKMLSKPEDNLFIVGDDDQSIYRFRGSRPEIMLNFEKDYQKTVRILLNENYRSTQSIVGASINLIKNNKNRFSKEIKAVREKGTAVEYRLFPSAMEENTAVINEITEHVRRGNKFSDIAILFRTNIGPRLLIDKLMEYNIPFHMKDVMPNIYDHFIAKDILTYIQIARGNRTRENLLAIINKPKRYVSREALRGENCTLQHIKMFYQDKRWMIDRIDQLEYDLLMLSKMSPFSAINYIRKGIQYDSYIEEYAAYRKMNKEDLLGILNELEEVVKPFKTYEEWMDHIEEYTNELKEQAKKNQRVENAIELSTMHSSKGLEYDTVFIIDAVEGVVPHNKAVLDEDLEEERRMFYVAVTRAKNRLAVYSVKERFDKPVQISRFVGEMKVDFETIVPSMKVRHKKYGDGVIKTFEDGKLSVYFPKLKKEIIFHAEYAFSNQILTIIDK